MRLYGFGSGGQGTVQYTYGIQRPYSPPIPKLRIREELEERERSQIKSEHHSHEIPLVVGIGAAVAGGLVGWVFWERIQRVIASIVMAVLAGGVASFIAKKMLGE